MKRLAALLLTLSAPAAWACATCSSANPTLNPMGAESLFAGRLRLGTTVRAWSVSEGMGDRTSNLRELRMDFSTLWAPLEWLALTANLPLQLREWTSSSLSHERGFGPGELELQSRFTVLREEKLNPRYVVNLVAGARLPTALTLRDSTGAPLSHDAQLGAGNFVLQPGVAWTGFATPAWLLSAQVLAELPLLNAAGARNGYSVSTSATAQYQPRAWGALRMGAEVRVATSGVHDGSEDPTGRGVGALASLDLLFLPTSDWLVSAGVRLPFISAYEGNVRPGLIGQASVVVDL